jgi:MFS family permease
MIILGIVIHGICYDFFFVTGQIYTDQVAPNRIRSQAQGLLVLFTLGLGMLIGAQIAGVVEGRYTPQASRDAAAQVSAKAIEIEGLQARRTSVTAGEQLTIDSQIKQLEVEKEGLRRDELKAIQWTPIWGIPAIFAAGVLILFVLFFKDKSRAPAVN